MNTYLYISCDSVTKINFSKTLQKLRQQKIDSLFTAFLSLSFLKKRSSQNAPDLEHVRRTGMKQPLLSQITNKPHLTLVNAQRHKEGLLSLS